MSDDAALKLTVTAAIFCTNQSTLKSAVKYAYRVALGAAVVATFNPTDIAAHDATFSAAYWTTFRPANQTAFI